LACGDVGDGGREAWCRLGLTKRCAREELKMHVPNFASGRRRKGGREGGKEGGG
jgi:hypothetical protein